MVSRHVLLPLEVLQIASPRFSRLSVARPRHFSGFASPCLDAVKYNVGYSFVGKPSFDDPVEHEDGDEAQRSRNANKPRKKAPARPSKRKSKILQGFPADSPVAGWRDDILKSVGHDLGAGHDFLFTRRLENRFVVGVADGVGGWEDSGCDPSVFSQALCWHAHHACLEKESPADILSAAYEQVLADPNVVAGSSTACFATLDDVTAKLAVANLGDSTFLVVRDGKVIHYQPSQTHFFNAPRQLTKLPKGMSGAGSLMDQPADADLYETTLRPDDLVFIVTDGWSDNVWPKELEQLVGLAQDHARIKKMDAQATVDNLARVAVNWARICSFKVDKHSPFEAEARRYGHNLPGGKVDDISVIAISVHKPS